MVRKSWGGIGIVVLTLSMPAVAQYMSTPPPEQRAAPGQPAPAARGDNLTITAKNGQTEKQQWADRYECHKWAKDQSGFDPTLRAPSEMSGDEINSHREQYRRAFSACLEGRGYSVQYGQSPPPARVGAAGAVAAAEPPTSHWVRSQPELRYRPIQGQIEGGYASTVGNSDRQLDDGSTVGFGLTWFPTSALPVGLRVDGSYSSFRARDAFLNQFGPNVYRGWDDVYGGDVDLQFDLAHASRSKFYLLGGAGWYRERATLREVIFGTGTFCDFYRCETGTGAFRATDHETSSWRSSWNAGLGWEMAYADGASFFVEARYRQIAPSDDRVQMVPITVGLRF
jgi:opacity protein-like surface antigen